MPLTQTALRFTADSTLPNITFSPPMTPVLPDFSKSPHTSSETLACIPDTDTIVVGERVKASSLPTPSDTATDASSQTSGFFALGKVRQGHSRRVTRTGSAQQSQDCLLEKAEDPQSRSVSGETLVANASESSLLRNSVAALNLQWSMGSLCKSDSQDDFKEENTSIESLHSSHEETEVEKTAQADARRKKMEENLKLREAKIKASDERATRRSSRASMLGKAGDAVSTLATSVLGKRSRDMMDKGMEKLENLKKRASLRPRSMVEPLPAAPPPFVGPTTKQRRLSEGRSSKVVVPETFTGKPLPALPIRKEKRWLGSGLYTGQKRDFDGRLTESKNKNKKKQKDGGEETSPVKENKVLPLPMFVGERLLEHGRDFKLPFDVFSPLPAGQPKPDEWRKTNKNVFVGDAAQSWRRSKFQEHSTCMCTLKNGCDSNCINRFMFYECDSGNCNLAEEGCGNRSFERLRQRVKKGGKYNVGVEVIKTSDRGYGVRSNRTFEPNQIIVEYTGEIITQDECDSRMRNLYKDKECYYLMLFDQNMIIDATRGSIARFVNHSCEPNCRMEKWTVSGHPRMALFAGERGIMTGEELTYDYNFDPFSQKNVQECRCGAKTCRGVLGPKPKEGGKAKSEKQASNSKSSVQKRKASGESKTDHVDKKRKTTFATTTSTLVRKLSGKSAKSVSQTTSRVRAPVDKAGQARDGEDAEGRVVMKKTSRSVSFPIGKAMGRKGSVLGRMMTGRKTKANATRLLLGSSPKASPIARGGGLGRKESVKAKAASMRRSIMGAVKGKRSG